MTRSIPARAVVRCMVWLAAVLLAAGALAQPAPGSETTVRLIVKFRDVATMSPATVSAATSSRLARFVEDAGVAGVTMTHLRPMALGAHVMALARPLPLAEAEALAARLARNPDVEFVQPDRRRHALLVPNDPFYTSNQQRYLGSTDPGAINATTAWDVSTGSANVIVAIVDTGYLPHAELAGRILPGYDFISDPKIANDGNGRDADASDPGDWITAEDQADPDFGKDCTVEHSSWHGTSLAGVVAANSNNGQGIAGINWAARILPVRVLGKCGGYDSDILDGIMWAAGLPVPGVPANPYPAQIINLSLGGAGDCLTSYHSAFSAALAHGVTRAIIVAAGNDAVDVSGNAPANCSEAIAVASNSLQGNLAGYSNFGAGITLSAPGGTGSGSNLIWVLSNFGTTTPAADFFAPEEGTSFAAPMVSGVASLVLGRAPNTTAAQLRTLLTTTATAFPEGATCTTNLCGAGIVNAYAAVVATGGADAATNYQGLWWKSPAASESGWGINFAHQGDTIFASWFTYDLSGRGWWLVMNAAKTGPNTYAGDLFETTGPAFNAQPFNPAMVSRLRAGSGTLTFSDANNGSFDYTISSVHQVAVSPVHQVKSITRQVFGPLPSCVFGGQPNLALTTNYLDLWWNSPAESESGWGINLTHEGDNIFATWFTYDLDGTSLWLSGTAAKVATGVYTGDLYRTTGPAFNAVPFDPNSVNRIKVGTVTFTFANGNSATFDYTVQYAPLANPVHQTKTIIRQVFAAPGTACQ